MTATEIKKALYKEKPIAKRIFYNPKRSVYACKLENGMTITFKIPNSDMGLTPFGEIESAHLLIRWLKE